MQLRSEWSDKVQEVAARVDALIANRMSREVAFNELQQVAGQLIQEQLKGAAGNPALIAQLQSQKTTLESSTDSLDAEFNLGYAQLLAKQDAVRDLEQQLRVYEQQLGTSLFTPMREVPTQGEITDAAHTRLALGG
jgi:predicted unusual protein kinase regulating ubiquinone biosynthesis (AarF/ABC1/UbiB family)